MTLDQFPKEELITLVTKVHFEHLNAFSQNQISRASIEMNSAVMLKYSIEQKSIYLNNLLNQINKEMSARNLSGEINLFDYEQLIREKIGSNLVKLDLKKFEFSNQQSIALLLETQDKLYEFIDDLKILIDRLKNAQLMSWEEIIQSLYQKSNSNIKLFNGFEERFDHSLIHGNETFIEILYNWCNFYDVIPTEMIRILSSSQKKHPVIVLSVEDEPIPENSMQFIDPKTREEVVEIFNKYVQNQIDLLLTDITCINVFREENDIAKIDVNIHSLYRELKSGNDEYLDDYIYISLRKKEVIIEKLKLLSNDLTFDSLFARKPEVENLELFTSDPNEMRIRLAECHKLLNGIFIEECPFIIFLSLFEKNQFIQPVNWIGKNSELNYLIKNISMRFTHDNFWARTSNCFMGKGTPFGTTSISSPRAKPFNDDDPRKLILDKVIYLIME